MLILAVEQDQVGEGLGRERRVVQQEVELLEAGGRILLNVHERLVVERNRVKFLLVTRRHVEKGLTSSSLVLHAELDGGLKVESFDEGSFTKCLRVANRLDLDTITVGADSKLRVFAHSFFDDISDVLQAGRQLLQFVVAQRDVVCNITLITGQVESLLELVFGVLIVLFLVEHAALRNESLSRFRRQLTDEGLGLSDFL